MLSFGTLAFAAPWLLVLLAGLPLLYWLLRVTPPNPRSVSFPALRLLLDLSAREETPSRTPLWLLILRLVLAALVILALARPLLNPAADLPGGGPLLLVVDDGWAAARDWPARQQAMERLLAQADRQGRPVAILTTAPAANGDAPSLRGPMAVGDARALAQSLRPSPWATDRAAATKALDAFRPDGSPYIAYLSDGIAAAGNDTATAGLIVRLRQFGAMAVLGDGAERPALLLRPPQDDGTGLAVTVERSQTDLPQPALLRALGEDGRLLSSVDILFAAGEQRRQVKLDLPTELRNQLSSLRLEGQETAGAVVLLDERWRRRPVGLVSGNAAGETPLLSDLYYLDKALAPFAEVRRGDIAKLLERDLAVLILADVGNLSEAESTRLEAWMQQGGVLLRFAGPRLAQNADRLVPVFLRAGDRALGGALSWEEPARLAPFAEDSPFAGLPVPDDVTVKRQVLAEPSVDLAGRTWARLADGTPLVTGERKGRGALVLVHTSAGPEWSNLALSGLYVDMLRRLVALSAGVAGGEQVGTLPPQQVLDGFGHLIPPPATAFPIAAKALAAAPAGGLPGPSHPPGFYGTADARQVLNLSPAVPALAAIDPLLAGLPRTLYAGGGEKDLMPTLLTMALILGLIDLLAGLWLRGLLPRPSGLRRVAPLALLLLGASLVLPVPRADAQPSARPASTPDEKAVQAANANWLAYVRTGDNLVDNTSRAGLEGLARALDDRTAIEVAGAMPIDLETDELAFYTLIYWPLTDGQAGLSDAVREKLNRYMRQGGMVLVDTRAGGAGNGSGPGGTELEALLKGLDIPPLAPVGPEHVLTRAFYLLNDFPGRYAGGEIWAEAREDQMNDGVSGIIIGANDWASAWAVDDTGRPLNAMASGSERQREMAIRTGINFVMYAMTGNYKADQVHVPAILERLGQ
jgi:hypothetical protein